jgi:DNA-directed RNA polymerase
MLVHNTRLLPMLVRPSPWRSNLEGGLLVHGPPAVRTNSREIIQADRSGRMGPVFRGLNSLNSTAWWVRALCFAGSTQDGGLLCIVQAGPVLCWQHSK